ncbi:glycine betaine ABC transporter substrate-binding protein [Tuberibacillus sp. Marseille-P3662]|uniref:glycine betaine ABC transporter substrate-binding protein n=1 Tax=Tuberibacillus sp. Marseille-P3662 TaxID=1965358 RepID=UPI000A1CB5AA|nr:glycine betaine ABC transporter substrate-binding protein [Tuberibacillus sp. Marseille-P3662]
MWRKTKLLALAAIFMLSIALSACGSNDSKNNDTANSDSKDHLGQKELTLPYVSWASATASNNVMKVVLENAGYDVTLKSINSGAMYTSLANGEADASVCIWLPHTDAKYWNQYKDKLVHLGPNIEGAPLGLAVPTYMEDINSIKDLAKNTNSIGEKLDWTITGIEPGAGQMTVTKNEVMPKYGLDKWELQSSSSPAMASALSQAIEDKKPIVVTLWSPHWAFSKFDLKYLKDPKNLYGDPDNINTIVRKGLKDDAPAAYKILNQFKWSKDQIGKVMVMINNGMDPAKAAKKWVNHHQDMVNKWTKGVK